LIFEIKANQNMIYSVIFLLKDYPTAIKIELFSNRIEDIEFTLKSKYKDNFQEILNITELNY
jgi:hypothetical protein